MASDALRQRRARGKTANQVVRARREKIGLAAGVLLLAVLLALEGPKTLKGLQAASSSPIAAPAAPTTVASHPVAPPAPPADPLKALSAFKAKDPFVPQLGSSGTLPAGPTPARPPRVRTTHFVTKDPFVQQLGAPPSAAPAATPVVPPKVFQPQPVPKKKAASARKQPKTLASLGSGTVVIVASVPVSRGQVAAQQAAAQVSARGVRGVHVARSSAFYAVYTGPYPTLANALTALKSIHNAGYASAYTRTLGH